MRTLKSTGGLTRGSNMSESQRSKWLLGIECSEYNMALQEFTKVKFENSEQHKDRTHSRMMRDSSDIEKLIEKLRPISPFCNEPSLQNISTGTTASIGVNAELVWSVGIRIIEKMKDKDIFSFSQRSKTKLKVWLQKHLLKFQLRKLQLTKPCCFRDCML